LEASLPEEMPAETPDQRAVETESEPQPAAIDESLEPAEPSVAPNPFEVPPAEGPADDAMPVEPTGRSRYDAEPTQPAFVTPAEPEPAAPTVPAEPQMPADGKYTVQPNDSLWKIAEKVYGDGRYFKAIGEHNRGRLPHADMLTAGAVLEVPPAGELTQLYPSLCPKQRRSAVVRTRQATAAPAPEVTNGNYIVQEGDTLFDIARYKLGRASRWGEIFELNREVLGEDFDFLQPGLELKMPSTLRE
jgi:nucleoid-associated protein YgaU